MPVQSMTINVKHFSKVVITFVIGCWLAVSPAMANDLPQAAGSPTAGITFDDRPLLLPVQRNFQMAMLTASSELGRSCGHIEAYGWRMGANEQERVNQIFNNTVDRMRAQGFVVETKAPNSVSRDVTMFTADRPDKHLIFMWSAGEIGLVMVLCETSAPVGMSAHKLTAPSKSGEPVSLRSNLETSQAIKRQSEALPLTRTGKHIIEGFTPVGDWVGSYTCMQGTMGATLHISSVRGDQFEGIFRFYPTSKNPYVPTGKYTVYGEYDKESHRILVNPGKWLQRPKDYSNTIIIGSFDPVAKTFSGYFQGINGCTSIEAQYSADGASAKGVSTAVAKTVKKPSAAKPKAKTKKKTSKDSTTSDATKTTKPASPEAAKPADSKEPAGIDLGAALQPPSTAPSQDPAGSVSLPPNQ